jgi:hypothetical protein
MMHLLAIFLSAFFFPQDPGYFQILSVSEMANLVSVDELGNIYTVSGDRLKMFNPGGKQLLVFEGQKNRKFSGIDIKDPDRVLVFYKETFKIFILNGLFKTTAELNLTGETGLFDVTLACLSEDEKIWVYSNNEKKLIKISDQGDFIARSAIVEDITGGKNQPNFLREYQQKLYLNNPRTGILEFDNQGNFIRIIPLKGLLTFCVANGKVCYVSGRNMKVYDIESGLEQITRLPDYTYLYTLPDLHGSELFLYYADPNTVGVISIITGQK